MEPQQRTHLVNQLMDEARLMQGVLEKAMEGQRTEARRPNLHGTHNAHEAYSLLDEQASWEKIMQALQGIQTELEQIAEAERQRVER
jgi:hypothetical protein